MNIEKYLNNLLKAEIKPIKTDLGLSNTIYQFEYNNNKYALRLPLNEGSKDHRQLERQIQIKAKSMDFEEFYYDSNSNIRITKWVDNLMTFSQYSNEDKYDKAIKRIKQFHKLDIKTDLKFNLKEKYQYFKNNIKNKLFDYEKYEYIIDSYYKLNTPIVLSHNDLVDGNICYKDGYCYLIDYEYASLNYEYFDLMSLLSENRIYDEITRNKIFNIYFGSEINDEILDQCSTIEQAQNLLWAAWANLEYEQKQKDIYLDIFKDKTNRINILSKKNKFI